MLSIGRKPRVNEDDDDALGGAMSLVQAVLADAATRQGFDVTEDDEGNFNVSVDMPGVKMADMTVEVEHTCGCTDCDCTSCQCRGSNVLHIRGSRKMTKEGGTVSETRFDKHFSVGDNVDINKLTANLEDGVLTLHAPKLEQERHKTRTIQVGENKMLEDK
jgi:HSP20 family molecular chaperone IbpA